MIGGGGGGWFITKSKYWVFKKIHIILVSICEITLLLMYMAVLIVLNYQTFIMTETHKGPLKRLCNLLKMTYFYFITTWLVEKALRSWNFYT